MIAVAENSAAQNSAYRCQIEGRFGNGAPFAIFMSISAQLWVDSLTDADERASRRESYSATEAVGRDSFEPAKVSQRIRRLRRASPYLPTSRTISRPGSRCRAVRCLASRHVCDRQKLRNSLTAGTS